MAAYILFLFPGSISHFLCKFVTAKLHLCKGATTQKQTNNDDTHPQIAANGLPLGHAFHPRGTKPHAIGLALIQATL